MLDRFVFWKDFRYFISLQSHSFLHAIWVFPYQLIIVPRCTMVIQKMGSFWSLERKNSNTSFELQVLALKKPPSEKDLQVFAALHAPHVKLLPVTADVLQVTQWTALSISFVTHYFVHFCTCILTVMAIKKCKWKAYFCHVFPETFEKNISLAQLQLEPTDQLWKKSHRSSLLKVWTEFLGRGKTKLQALVYNILLQTTAIIMPYVSKKSANGHIFIRAQMAVTL